MERLRPLLRCLVAPLLIGAGLAGCKQAEQAMDAPVVVADGGASKACPDAAPNQWTAGSQSSAATSVGDEIATLLGVWGASPQAIFAVGTKGTVVFFDGKEWKRQETPSSVNLTAVWGTSAKDVWAVGFGGTVLHYDGTSWKDQSPPLAVFQAGDAGVPTDAAVTGRRNLWGVWAAGQGSTTALYAVGDQGTVIYFDGAQKLWSDKIPISADGKAIRVQDQLNAVWGTSADKVYIVGNFSTVLAGSNKGLTMQKVDLSKPVDLNGVWGRNDDDVYVVGNSGTILHYGSGSWKTVTGAGCPKQVLRAVWGPPNDPAITYIVGWDGTLLRLSGGPSFSEGGTFEPFYCIVPGRRLEDLWGTMVPRTSSSPAPRDGAPPAVNDSGVSVVPAIWAVGASGMVITGP